MTVSRRVTVNLSPRGESALQALAELWGDNATDIIHRSLEMAAKLAEADADHAEICVQYPGQDPVRVWFL